jgi:nucleotide-binding universal stress UspA family protein
MGRIVVGVDGSDASVAALTWAAEEARLRDAELHVVTSFGPSGSLTLAGDGIAWSPEIFDRMQEHARDVQDRAIGALDEPLPKLEQEVAMGTPANALLQAAQHADLLVIGSRGMGGFKGLLLGSVSHKCVTHAPCPVVVIPSPATDEHTNEQGD